MITLNTDSLLDFTIIREGSGQTITKSKYFPLAGGTITRSKVQPLGLVQVTGSDTVAFDDENILFPEIKNTVTFYVETVMDSDGFIDGASWTAEYSGGKVSINTEDIPPLVLEAFYA